MSTAQGSFRRWLGRAAPASPVGVPARHEAVMPSTARSMRPAVRRGQALRQLGLLTVTVEQVDLLRIRAALNYSGAHSVEFVRVTPIAASTRVRVDIALQLDSVDEAMHTILCSVSEGEFGRVTIKQASRHTVAASLRV